MKTLLIVAFVLFTLALAAQPKRASVVIGSMTSRPNALLIVNPQNSDQGVLLPQLSSGQRMSLRPSSPAEDGLLVFDTNAQAYYYWSAGAWVKVKPQSTKPQYYSIDPLNFQELKPDLNIRHTNMVVFETDNSFVTASRNGQGEEIIAALDLPHGATMRAMNLYYMDNDDDNIRIRLLRKTLTGASEQILAWESSGASASVNTATFENFNGKEQIDLERYTYRLIVIFDIDEGEEIDTPLKAKQRLYGVRIEFEQ